MPKPFGVVDILVSGKPPKHGLTQHTDQSMAAVLAGAGVGERLAGHRAKAECVVKFTVCKQTGVRSDHRTAELERQSAVEIEPERLRHPIHPPGSSSPPRSIQNKVLMPISESA